MNKNGNRPRSSTNPRFKFLKILFDHKQEFEQQYLIIQK